MDHEAEDPKTLGRYEVERRLAKGAMGVVYVGRDPKLDRPIALKTLLVSDIIDRETAARLRERFLEEPRITAQLRHPNVVPVYDAGIDPDTGVAWLALELVEGGDLTQLMKKGLTPRRVLDIADDVAAALDHAHQRGIVHRDVKPANILIDQDGRARLTDFGIAHESDAGRTRPGEFLGSPAYMAPEQIGGGEISSRTDIHALGAVLYESLTGRRPFEATKTATTAQAVLTRMPEPPSRIAAHLPRSLDAVFRKALAKKPEGRHETAGELAAGVRRALASLKPAINPDAETTVALAGREDASWARAATDWMRSSASSAATAAHGVASWGRGKLRSSVSSVATAAHGVASWGRGKQALLVMAAFLLLATATLFAWPEGPPEAELTPATRLQDLPPSRPPPADSSPVETDAAAEGGTTSALAGEAAPREVVSEPADARGATDAQPARTAAETTTTEVRAEPAPARPKESGPRPAAPPPRTEKTPVVAPARGEPAPPATRRAAATTHLVLDVYTSRDGLLTVLEGNRELLRSQVEDLKRMPARFRAIGKKRYRARLDVPSAGVPLTIRFEPKNAEEPAELSVTWDLPPGGHALAAVEIGLRGRELEAEVLETAPE